MIRCGLKQRDSVRYLKRAYGVFLLFCYVESFSQNTITGRILSKDGQAVQGANITANATDGSGRISFSFSKKEGTYVLKINTASDSLVVLVSKLNFLTQTRTVINKNQVLDFTLEEGAHELREVKIKPPPVRKLGDTLRYNINEFQAASDRTVSDVIRKLPGIEINANGTILYQGKAINAYYVEGLDLMEGRYSLVNENLSLTGVASVEVFENHQPIRILDSLKVSDRAALNIRLKKRVVTSYAVHYGVGGQPFLWDLNITPMVFTPRMQMAASLQSNNTGRNIRSQLINHAEGEGTGLEIPSAGGWLSIPPLPVPAFSSSRWLDNRSNLASLNALKKYRNEMQVKVNAFLSMDQLRQQGNTVTTYYLPEDTIRFSEETSNKVRYNTLNGGVTFLRNLSQKYFQNHFSFEKEWNAGAGTNERKEMAYAQSLSTDHYTLKNNLHSIFNRGKVTYNLYSNTTAAQTYQNLHVGITAPDSSATPYQIFRHKKLNTHNYAEFNRKVGKLNFATQAGNLLDFNRIYTHLTDYPGLSASVNDFSWKSSRTYISGITSFNPRSPGWFFLLELPLSHNYFSYHREGETRTMHKVAFEPRLFARRKISSSAQLIGSIRYQNQLPRPEDIYTYYVMTSYLNLVKKNTSFRNNHLFTGTIGVNYNNPMAIILGNLNYSYTRRVNNLLGNIHLGADGLQEIQNLDRVNVQQNHIVSGRLSKYFLGPRLTPAISLVYMNTRTERMLNGQSGDFEYATFTPSVNIRYSGLNKVDLSYNGSVIRMWNTSTTSEQYSQTLSLGIRPVKKIYFTMLLEHYRNDLNKNRKDYFFSDASVRWSPGKSSHALEAGFSNLFNTKVFRTISASDYYYSESSYILRPAQVVLRGRIHI